MRKRHYSAVVVFMCMVCLTFAGRVFAAPPLITDDTGTQGKGKYEVDVTGQYDHDKNNGTTTQNGVDTVTLSYGIVDSADLVLAVPYSWWKTSDASGKAVERGIADSTLDVKWRFYEKDGLSFALKPGLTLPTGDDEKGLGAGKTTYHLFFITTQELKPWAFHLNLAYIRNENNGDERTDLWHVSAALERELVKDLKFVADMGMERSADKGSNINPAYLLGGLIYTVNEHLDAEFGVKGGLNKAEPDYSLLAGITLRF